MEYGFRDFDVSIQLVSPASGDGKTKNLPANYVFSFHSIGVPSEWGHGIEYLCWRDINGFHSIGFPSEWGLTAAQKQGGKERDCVSIQLVSPASGGPESFRY